MRGPIRVVRTPVVHSPCEDGEIMVVDARYSYSTRTILVNSLLKRNVAWIELETMRYCARFNDMGLHFLFGDNDNLFEAVTEALARQHVRSWRREGPPLMYPGLIGNANWPALSRLVYEYGDWIEVERFGPTDVNETESGVEYGRVNNHLQQIGVLRALPLPSAWHTLWHERYEARVYESTAAHLVDENLKEAICDAMATARVIEGNMIMLWATHPDTYPSTPATDELADETLSEKARRARRRAPKKSSRQSRRGARGAGSRRRRKSA